MQCPVCQVPLVMTDRQGIEIDYCPQCRGVWLDRGELDKIIERGNSLQGSPQAIQAPPPPMPPQPMRPPAPYPPQQHHDPYYRQRQHHDPYYRHHRRRKSWLEDIFD